MCGIAGVYDPANRLSADELRRIAQTLGDAMEHRGPDDAGVWLSQDNRCALAHRRLSIIDTSSKGHQPFERDGMQGLSYNGEIYNYLELKAQFSFDEPFVSSSDTEVLFKGLRKQGIDFLTYLDGMFAFAYYDVARKELLLAIDRFGEKPLYYSHYHGALVFASEMKAFQSLDGFTGHVTRHSVASYLAFQHVPAPRTIFDNVFKLAGGSFLRIDQSLTLQPQTYSHFDAHCKATRDTFNEQVETLDSLLTQSIERRLRADVPLGAFLSGGIDSSSVVSIVSQKFGRSVNTYSVGFSEGPSEHEAARDIARHLNTRHHEVVLPSRIFVDSVDKIATMDEPNADTSCVPTYLVSELAAQTQKVCLTGDGGDELFGGYQRYYQVMDKAVGKEAEMAARSWHLGYEYVGRVTLFNDRDLRSLFGEVPGRTADTLRHFRRGIDISSNAVINRFREYDVHAYLPLVLAKVDRMSMQHSLESRTPFLNPELVSFASQLSEDALYRDGQGKALLRNVLYKYLPENLTQKQKMGFSLDPRNNVAREQIIGRLMDEIASPASELRNVMSATALHDYCDNVLPERGFYNAWGLLVLELFLRNNKYKVIELYE